MTLDPDETTLVGPASKRRRRHKLTDIHPAEISFVTRGANRRPFLFLKSDEFDETIATALETPGEGERELIAALAKAGADDDAIKRLLAAGRLLNTLPPEMESVVRKVAGLPPAPAAPKANGARPGERLDDYLDRQQREREGLLRKADETNEQLEKQVDAGALEQLERRADEIYRRDPELIKQRDAKVAKGVAFAKALEEKPELYEAHRRHVDRLRQGGSTVAIEAGQSAERTIEQRARELVAKSDLTFEQAYVRVAKEAPDLYALVTAGHQAEIRKAQAEATAPPTAETQRAKDDAYARIRKAADEVRREDSSLTPEQAEARALELKPDLYTAYREA